MPNKAENIVIFKAFFASTLSLISVILLQSLSAKHHQTVPFLWRVFHRTKKVHATAPKKTKAQ
jgi:type IV secretory pathway component VirB8